MSRSYLVMFLATYIFFCACFAHADDDEFDVRFGGFIKFDAIRDLDAIGDAYKFATRTIPTTGSVDARLSQRVTYSLRASRLTLAGAVDTRRGNFDAFLSVDFFGGSGTKPEPRLRKAYGTLGPLLVGQTNSAFVNPGVWAHTLDFEGPNARLLIRHGIIKWTFRRDAPYTVALSIEDPSTELTVQSPDLVGQSDIPDLVLQVRGTGSRGHFQVAGLLRNIRAIDARTGSDATTTGWGAMASARIDFRERDNFRFEVVYGEGSARYVLDLQETGSDAYADTLGNITAITSYGAYAAFEIGFTKDWISNLIYGTVRVDNLDQQGGSAYRQTQYAAVNVMWNPVPKMETGLEVLWGERTNKDLSEGEAVRLQFSTKIKFN